MFGFARGCLADLFPFFQSFSRLPYAHAMDLQFARGIQFFPVIISIIAVRYGLAVASHWSLFACNRRLDLDLPRNQGKKSCFTGTETKSNVFSLKDNEQET